MEEFFLDVGFELLTFPLSQYNERLIPADFIFFDRGHSKLFGFQYKALYRNNRDYWSIDSQQQRKLTSFPWIYYCLSELKLTRDFRSALHQVRIVSTNIHLQERVYPSGNDRLQNYMRWGAFYQRLEACYEGVEITSREQLNDVLCPEDNVELPRELTGLMVDIFLSNFDSRRAVHLSPRLTW